jgi:hypothetical protein
VSTLLNEEVACQTWLRDYLAADSTLASMISGVWVHSVPMKEPLPVVKIDRQDSSDLYTVNLFRVWDDLLYLVRGVVHWTGSGQQDWTDVQAIGDRLDVLLHKVTVVTSTLSLHAFREQSYVDEQPSSDGTTYMHCGGFYRIRAHAL